MRYVYVSLYVFVLILGVVSCSVFDNNPKPELSSISPGSMAAHMPSFTLTVNGSNFISGSSIVFDGIEKPTVFVSAAELTCQIDPVDTIPASCSAGESIFFENQRIERARVLVRNPSPGGGDSNFIDFKIRDNHIYNIPENLSNNLGESGYPAIAVDGQGNIDVVWSVETPDSSDIYFIRSTDEGASWSEAVNVSKGPGISDYPDIAIDDSGNIGVVWYDRIRRKYDIYFSRSIDDGASWSKAVNISKDSGDSFWPVIAVNSSGDINVVWVVDYRDNEDVYFSRSKDNGVSWSKAVNLSNNPGYSSHPAIAIDVSGNIGVVWYDENSGNFDIYFRRSTNGGDSWNQVVNISKNSGNSCKPAIAVDSAGNISVVWHDYTSGHPGIYFSRSTHDGEDWSQAENIFGAVGYPGTPAIAIDVAGNIDVVWYNHNPRFYGIFFTRSIDDGTTWERYVEVSGDLGNSVCPDIAVDSSGNIDVVWLDCTPGSYDIYYTSSIR